MPVIDVKLGTKVAGGFFFVVVLIFGIGIISSSTMNGVIAQSERLQQEFIPEIHMAENFANSMSSALFEMRGFHYTGDDALFQKASKELDRADKALAEGVELSKKYPDLLKLREGLENGIRLVTEYKQLVQQTGDQEEKIAAKRTEMNQEAQAFMKSCYDYLHDQNGKMKKNIDEFGGLDTRPMVPAPSMGAAPRETSSEPPLKVTELVGMANHTSKKTEALQDRFWKTIRVNDIIDLGNDLRVAVWNFQAVRDPEVVRSALGKFDEISEIADDLLAKTTQQANVTQLNSIKKEAANYREDLETLLASWDAKAKVDGRRLEIAALIEAEASKIMEGALTDSGSGAKSAVQSLGNASFGLKSGIGLIALISVVLALILISNIRGILKTLQEETRNLIDAAIGGKLSARGDVHRINFEFQPILAGFNQVLDAVIGPLNVSAEYVDRISKGDIPPKITDQYQGDFNEIKNNLNNCIDNLNALVTDANLLAKAAIEGKLGVRAEALKHQGDYRRIVEGVNRTMETLVDFIDTMPVTAVIIDRDFNIRFMNKTGCSIGNTRLQDLENTKCYNYFKTEDCKTDKCACYQAMSRGEKASSETIARPRAGLDLDIQYSAVPVTDASGQVIGALEVVTDQTAIKSGIRLNQKISCFQEKEVVKVQEGLGKMALGDLDFEIQIAEGDADTAETRKTFQTIANAISRAKNAVLLLTEDASHLSIAAIEGKLAARAEVGKHQGAYRQVIEGVNRTLDSVIGPLNVAAEYVDRISKGDIPKKITDSYRGDFNEIKNNINSLIEAMESITQSAREISQGNLTVKIRERSPQDELMKSLSTMSGSLSRMFTDISRGIKTLSSSAEQLTSVSGQMNKGTSEVAAKAGTVATASEEMSSSASSVAVSMEQASTSLASVATATEQMTATIGEIAGNSEKARSITNQAVNQANDVSVMMRDLGQAAQEIGKFTETITSISAQTNMLALNATIEAARAGAAGKGFAVVANEIKELAKQAAAATEDIKTRISGIQSSTENAIGDIEKISHVIRDVSEIVSSIATAMEEQATVTKQIAGNIAQASTGVYDTNQRVAQTSNVAQSITREITVVSSATAELGVSGLQVDNSSKQLSRLAEELNGLVAHFRI